MDYSLLGSSLPPWDSPDKSTGVGCHFLLQGSLPGSSLYGILQARVLEWVTISFSRGSSQPRDRTQVSGIPGRHFNLWATFEWLLISWISKMFYHQIVSKTIYKLIKTLLTPTLSYCSMQSIWKVKALGSTETVGEYVLDAGKD